MHTTPLRTCALALGLGLLLGTAVGCSRPTPATTPGSPPDVPGVERDYPAPDTVIDEISTPTLGPGDEGYPPPSPTFDLPLQSYPEGMEPTDMPPVVPITDTGVVTGTLMGTPVSP
jgi:hypothetical protein